MSDNSDICGSCSDNTTTEICANCGKEGDSLKSCAACKLVKYCNRDCQIAHRKLHKKECRKRAAELHDIELFKQPPPPDNCPICFLQLPSLNTGTIFNSCCEKVLCSGCAHAPVYDSQGNEVAEQNCVFCRTPVAASDEEEHKRLKKRVEANDPIGLYNVANTMREECMAFHKIILRHLLFCTSHSSCAFRHSSVEVLVMAVDSKLSSR